MLIMYDSPRRITLHHNLFIKAESRSPQVQTDGFGTPATDTTVDMRNNVIWDWRGGYGSRIRYGPRVNIINNFYAANGGDARDALIVCPGPECDDSNPASAARVYAKGNISADGIDLDARGNQSAPFPSAPVETQDAKTGACEVLADAGVRPLDNLDQQYLSMVSLPWCSGGTDLPPVPPPPPDPEPPAQPGRYRVNIGGGNYIDGGGNRWSADQTYRTGSWGYSGGTSYGGAASIANTADDPLYQTERYGNFSYKFDVANGIYDVTLHFAEIYWKNSGERKFNVLFEGRSLLDNFDIVTTAGSRTAVVKTFSGVTVRDGRLDIDFRATKDNAKVSAISVMKSSNSAPPPPAPVPPPQPANYSKRVNSGGRNYTDADGNQWSADQAYRIGSWGYLGGSSYRGSASIANT
ncbi:MAG: malectin domain-containing carbohydrate-binding protein, partial [Candidatus Binatia bacterium]